MAAGTIIDTAREMTISRCAFIGIRWLFILYNEMQTILLSESTDRTASKAIKR
jgi:hypothetical protein